MSPSPTHSAPAHGGAVKAPSRLHDVDASDPRSELIQRSGLAPAAVAQINDLMAALVALREAEQRLSEASLTYMRLNQTDMRALHFLIVAGHRGTITTPGALAEHLRISTASVTKMLDRLERGGHITRAPHPTDRRALAISITPETREAAMNTVGRQQAKRFHAAARLTSDERAVVIRFLEDMTREISLDDAEWAHPHP